MNVYKGGGHEQLKLRNIHPDTGADTQCIGNRWWGKACFAPYWDIQRTIQPTGREGITEQLSLETLT